MESISRRLTNTGAILSYLPKMLDLADDRELAMLAAFIKGYVDFGGPEAAVFRPGYIEEVMAAVMIKDGEPLGEDLTSNLVDYVLEYERQGEATEENGLPLHAARRGEYSLLRAALSFATWGEEVAPDPGENALSERLKKPCTMRRAMELAIETQDREAAEAEAKRALEAQDAKPVLEFVKPGA